MNYDEVQQLALVFPAKAGIRSSVGLNSNCSLDGSRLRGDDGSGVDKSQLF